MGRPRVKGYNKREDKEKKRRQDLPNPSVTPVALVSCSRKEKKKTMSTRH